MWEYTDKVKDHFLNPRNVGVIGVAAFEEKHRHYHPHPVLQHHHDSGEAGRRHAADPFPSEGRFAKPPRA